MGALRSGHSGRQNDMRNMQCPHVEAERPHLAEGDEADQAGNVPAVPHAAMPGVLEIQEPLGRQRNVQMVPNLLGKDGSLRSM